jgi:hypothetical protein
VAQGALLVSVTDRDRMTALFKAQFELCRVKEGEMMVLLGDPVASSLPKPRRR